MPDLPSFSTQGDAATAGWIAGTRWIDKNRIGELPVRSQVLIESRAPASILAVLHGRVAQPDKQIL